MQPSSSADVSMSSTTDVTASTGASTSVFVAADAPVYDMPVSVINRPLMSDVDQLKVQRFVEDMKGGAQFTPIEVAHVQEGGKNYYFAFGGCHRWAAVKQLGLPTIRARLIEVSPATINTYLGASSPFRHASQAASRAVQHREQPVAMAAAGATEQADEPTGADHQAATEGAAQQIKHLQLT